MATSTIQNWQELERLVNKLSRNRASVPEKDRMGRYKKAFRKLEEEICRKGDALFPYLMVSGLRVLPEDSAAFFQAAGKAAAQAKESGYPAKLRAALTVSCDMELFLAYAFCLQCDITEQFYADYWLRHTMEVDGRFYNDLVHMWYDGELEIWKSGKDCSFGIFFPPEREAFLQQVQENRNELSAIIAKRTSAVSVCCRNA